MSVRQNANEARHINDHSEEEMLQIVAVTDDRENLERLLAAKRERTIDFKPRPSFIEAILEKLSKCGPSDADRRHLAAVRKIYDSYGSSDPGLAEKVKASEARFLEVQKKTFEALRARDKRVARMRQTLKG